MGTILNETTEPKNGELGLRYMFSLVPSTLENGGAEETKFAEHMSESCVRGVHSTLVEIRRRVAIGEIDATRKDADDDRFNQIVGHITTPTNAATLKKRVVFTKTYLAFRLRMLLRQKKYQAPEHWIHTYIFFSNLRTAVTLLFSTSVMKPHALPIRKHHPGSIISQCRSIPRRKLRSGNSGSRMRALK